MSERSVWDKVRHDALRVAQHNDRECQIAEAEGLACWVEQEIEKARLGGAELDPGNGPERVDHIEAAEAWLATCQGEASRWSTVQAVSAQASAHALVDIATNLRGLREDLQALTATMRDVADGGVRVVTD